MRIIILYLGGYLRWMFRGDQNKTKAQFLEDPYNNETEYLPNFIVGSITILIITSIMIAISSN
jgi:hypothetical protein